MLSVDIIAVGALKEKFYVDGTAEYIKRCSAYCKLTVRELQDERIPANVSEAGAQQIMQKEAKKILDAIPKTCYKVALDVRGKQITSEGLAGYISKLTAEGRSHIVFIIGGSLGLHSSVSEVCDAAISLSNMTFTHQLARMVLAEQLYRAFTIINNKPYHR